MVHFFISSFHDGPFSLSGINRDCYLHQLSSLDFGDISAIATFSVLITSLTVVHLPDMPLPCNSEHSPIDILL